MGYGDLLAASLRCRQEARPLDQTFFLLVSQIRFGVDAELLHPADEREEWQKSKLASVLFYQAGGSGPDDIYRDPTKTEALYARLRAWRARYYAGYDPGWKYKRLPELDDALEASERHTHNRIEKLKYYAALMTNDEYYEAHKRRAELSRKHNGRFVANSPAYAENLALGDTINRIKRDLNLSQPKLRTPVKIHVDPDADFRPIFIGGNGPDKPGSMTITRANQIEDSFLARALTADQIRQVLAKVDMNEEVLVVLTVGKRATATGTLVITKLSVAGLDDLRPELSYRLMIGVTEKGCDLPQRTSYPFIIVAKKRASIGGQARSRGWYRGNFADGCRLPMTGELNN